ncbi:hypothetical protein GE253_14905 [Niveispirillum sp. SYP-B3756]|nr:hypothetical protein [Niveispirillum sp. SYP-B3756]
MGGNAGGRVINQGGGGNGGGGRHGGGDFGDGLPIRSAGAEGPGLVPLRQIQAQGQPQQQAPPPLPAAR